MDVCMHLRKLISRVMYFWQVKADVLKEIQDTQLLLLALSVAVVMHFVTELEHKVNSLWALVVIIVISASDFLWTKITYSTVLFGVFFYSTFVQVNL